MRRLCLAVLLAGLGLGSAQAGLFDDDLARRQIAELKTATESRYDTHSKALVDLANQMQELRDEQAKLRGQLETINYGIEQINKRLQDFYVDVDGRLRKFETQNTPADSTPKPPPGEALSESKDYEAALSHFKAGKYKDAATAFSAFVTKYAASPLAPNAQFWLGNAWYAQRDCKRAVEAQNALLTMWPASPKAPEAMLAIATCQFDGGNPAAARRTLESLVAQFPESPIAETARQRLRKK